MDKTVLLTVGFLNVLAFVLFGIDKHRAINGKWRIQESTLIAVSVLGGCFGAYLGMRVFHHKTRKPLFRYGIPVILLLWIGIWYLYCRTAQII